jgi:hypothetical protein
MVFEVAKVKRKGTKALGFAHIFEHASRLDSL